MRKFFIIILLLVTSVTGVFIWQVWQNNREIEPVSHADIQQHFLKSVSWLNTNYSVVENTRNPILWWMIKQAALISENDSLNSIYKKYKKDHLYTNPPNLSTPMFDKFYRPRLPDISLLSNLQDYQIFFFMP